MNGCPKRIGVLGAGSFGTALAVHLAGAGGHPVRLWARSPELARQMADERANPKYLPDVAFPVGIQPTSDMADLGDSEFLLVAAPSHGFREVLRQFLRQHPDGEPLPLVSATKGIEPETLARMSQVAFEEAMAADREVRFAALSGPTFAAELDASRTAQANSNSNLVDFFISPSNYARWRELTITFDPPASIAQKLRANRATLSVSGRNLWMKTNYPGFEPEAMFLGGTRGGNAAWEQTTLPQLRTWLFSVNLGY